MSNDGTNMTQNGRFATEEGHMQKSEIDLPDADSFNGFCSRLWAVGAYVSTTENPAKMRLMYMSTASDAVCEAIRDQMGIECQRIKDAADPMKKLQAAT